jgi:GT2 family glycosyltransferase/ubiquinone/menaquinone biosynthesis C-methylase UbiE
MTEPPAELLALPFDLYERYSVSRRLISLLWPGETGLRILDVGGHSSPLKQLAEEHRVFLLDVAPPGSLTHVPLRYDGYIQGSGAILPFADRAFDLVTAHDTLEHIPEEFREGFIREVLRVSKGVLILNQPVYHPETEKAESTLLDYLSAIRPEENRFLKEHAEYGLPRTERVEAILRDAGVDFASFANGNLALWVTTNLFKNYALAFPNGGEAAESIDRTFNTLLAERDLAGHCYRRAYVVAADTNLADRVHGAADGIVASASQAGAAEDMRVIEKMKEGLQEHAAGVRETLQRYHEMATQLRQDVLDRDKRISEEVGARQSQVAEREATIKDLRAVMVGKEEQVREKDLAIAKRDRLVLERDEAIAGFESRRSVRAGRSVRRGMERVAPAGSRRRNAGSVLRKGGATMTREGPLAFLAWLFSFRWVPALFRKPPLLPRQPVVPEGRENDDYQMWLAEHGVSRGDLVALRDRGERFGYRPRISVVMPVYNTDPRWLEEAIDSVRSQTYGNWQLCIADDGSTNAKTREVLRRAPRSDRRIRVTMLSENRGISAASNQALSMARGEFVALLDHDDVLHPDALHEVVAVLNEQRDLDYIYTDEDKLELDGSRSNPFFKPDWSPDLLLSLNYVTHLSVFRREVVDRVGGFRTAFDGAQDWDLILRVTEQTDRIAHVPKPVYSWRKAVGSAASSEEAKPYAYRAAKRAIGEALERRGMAGEVGDGVVTGYYDVRYAIRGEPRVAIVIPTRDRLDMLERCIDSIRERTTYRNHEIVVVDNDSAEPKTLEYLEAFDGVVIRQPGPFNFSRIINGALAQIDAEQLLLLNNDTEILTDDWIEAMLEHAQRPDVAAVGARLLFPDGRPQHEGVLVGPGDGLAGNIDTGRYLELGRTIRDCSAVTAACMMTRGEVFRELGGFEEQLGVAYQDVDYCLRAREKGYLVVYTPLAEVAHLEGGTRGRTGRTHPEENERFFRERWRGYRDPYYNPNLDIDRPYRLPVGGPSA